MVWCDSFARLSLNCLVFVSSPLYASYGGWCVILISGHKLTIVNYCTWTVWGSMRGLCLGGLVCMLYDILLFVTTAGTAIIVGSLSMCTLHSFIGSELMTLAFSVITAGVFVSAVVILTVGWSRVSSVFFIVIDESMIPRGFGLGTQVLSGFRICFTSPNTHSCTNTSSKWHYSRILFRSPGRACWMVLHQ